VKVAIIGLGVVGRAQEELFAGHDLVRFDPLYHTTYPAESIRQVPLAVVCVDTPPSADGSADLRHLDAAMHQLPYGVPVLIRSTVPPGTTDGYAGHRLVCHAPEFMQERQGGRWRTSGDVPFMLLGGTAEALRHFRPLLDLVYAGRIHECTALEAELAKYTSNLYWATRVTFVNELGRICAALGADWEEVRRAWLEDDRVAADYTALDGFPPGFDGRCWPKDMSALLAASEKAGYLAEFLMAVQAANERFRALCRTQTGRCDGGYARS
jgi:nucleotide sugar dehydrogenase